MSSPVITRSRDEESDWSERLLLAIDRNLKWVLIAPAMIVLLGLMVYPLIRALQLSVLHFTPVGTTEFVGLQNFRELLHNGQFHNSLWVTATFMFWAVLGEMVIGFAIAMLLNKKLKFRGTMQTLILVPIVVSPTVVALLWRLLYSDGGIIELLIVPVLGHDVDWLSDPSIALWAIIIPDIWQWTPLVVLVILAGLQAIPDHVHEAAIMDGASRWQRFTDITLPYLKNLIVLLLILRVVGTLRVFAKVFVLTRGGPSDATNVVSMELYRQAFRFTNFGQAAAMSLVLLVFVVAMAMAFTKLADVEF